MPTFYSPISEYSNLIVRGAHAHVAATGNEALSGLRTIAFYAIVDNDVVLLTAQTAPTENGLWRAHSGAWTRHERWPTGAVYPRGMLVMPANSVYTDTIYEMAGGVGITVGTDASVWAYTPLPDGSITMAKLANIATNTLIGRNVIAPGVPSALTAAQVKTLLAIANTDVSGLGTASTLASGVMAPPVDVQQFTASGTWTKPTSSVAAYTKIQIVCIAGGSGGGSGRKGAAATVRGGGGGGGGGSVAVYTMRASLAGATETVTVGAGGNGGAAQATNSTNGNDGTVGGNSSFGAWVRAVVTSTQFGGGGTATGGAAGAAGVTAGTSQGTAGAAASGTGTTGAAAANNYMGAAGGGSGGGITTGNVFAAGGAGGIQAAPNPGRAGGVAGATAGAAGSTPATVSATGEAVGGAGAGGGASISAAGTGGAGGVGGAYGGGGGGGGAALDTTSTSSGAGGAGGGGLVLVFTS